MGEGVELTVEALIASRDPGIADESAGEDGGFGLQTVRRWFRPGPHREKCTENGFRLFPYSEGFRHPFLHGLPGADGPRRTSVVRIRSFSDTQHRRRCAPTRHPRTDRGAGRCGVPGQSMTATASSPPDSGLARKATRSPAAEVGTSNRTLLSIRLPEGSSPGVPVPPTMLNRPCSDR